MQEQAGLDDAEAARRQAQHCPNALPGSEPKPLWRIAAGVLAEPMFLMLPAAPAALAMALALLSANLPALEALRRLGQLTGKGAPAR